MKKSLMFAVMMLSALVWAGAQQPTSPSSSPSGAQATTPSSGMPSQAPDATAPGASQTAPGAPSATPQAGTSGQGMNGSITEGCLGGSNPNFTLTDSKGKAYKLVLPQGADGSKLTSHVGESIQVLGDVSGGDSISVSKVGKGNGTCPGK
jgi:hypothetical protein